LPQVDGTVFTRNADYTQVEEEIVLGGAAEAPKVTNWVASLPVRYVIQTQCTSYREGVENKSRPARRPPRRTSARRGRSRRLRRRR
jgi:hypothetical protein